MRQSLTLNILFRRHRRIIQPRPECVLPVRELRRYYRKSLRRVAFIWDPIVREYLWNAVRDIYRKKTSANPRQDMVESTLKRAKKIYSKLGAIWRRPIMCNHVLMNAYARAGFRRTELLSALFIEPVLRKEAINVDEKITRLPSIPPAVAELARIQNVPVDYLQLKHRNTGLIVGKFSRRRYVAKTWKVVASIAKSLEMPLHPKQLEVVQHFQKASNLNIIFKSKNLKNVGKPLDCRDRRRISRLYLHTFQSAPSLQIDKLGYWFTAFANKLPMEPILVQFIGDRDTEALDIYDVPKKKGIKYLRWKAIKSGLLPPDIEKPQHLGAFQKVYPYDLKTFAENYKLDAETWRQEAQERQSQLFQRHRLAKEKIQQLTTANLLPNTLESRMAFGLAHGQFMEKENEKKALINESDKFMNNATAVEAQLGFDKDSVSEIQKKIESEPEVFDPYIVDDESTPVYKEYPLLDLLLNRRIEFGIRWDDAMDELRQQLIKTVEVSPTQYSEYEKEAMKNHWRISTTVFRWKNKTQRGNLTKLLNSGPVFNSNSSVPNYVRRRSAFSDRILRHMKKLAQYNYSTFAPLRMSDAKRHLQRKVNNLSICISHSFNPQFNIALEDYIYSQRESGSAKLLFYVNDPCIVIGRNQNVWREVNTELCKSLNMPIIRRYSGGGTVFHDRGNVNFSLMTDKSLFDRKAWSNIIIRALENIKVAAKLNDRFDIVLDRTGNKISGSAYKFSKFGAYYHGTMLLNSNIDFIGDILSSPWAQFINGNYGVSSRRSPVENIQRSKESFIFSLMLAVKEFFKDCDLEIQDIDEKDSNPNILERVKRLESYQWTFEASPEFYFNVDITNINANAINIKLKVKGGYVKNVEFEQSQELNGSTLKALILNKPFSLDAVTQFKAKLQDNVMNNVLV